MTPIFRCLILLAALSLSGGALADLYDAASKFNMPQGVTDVSREIYWLHMTVFWITVAIGIVVFGLMFWAMIFHRKSPDRQPATFDDNKYLEVAWTVVAALILVVIAWPATVSLWRVNDTSASDLTIETRAYQWKWQYKYLDENQNTQVSFFSNMATPEGEIQNRETKGQYYLLEVDEMLVIPTNRKVRFLVTSNDVIHAFWVPDFGIKGDAVPGYVNERWTIVTEPGVYRGQCTELCGRNHAFMPIVVRVLEENEYEQWYAQKVKQQKEIDELSKQEWTSDQLFARGQEVYVKNCVACHLVNGQGLPPAFPSLVGTDMVLNDQAAHIDIVYNGKAGTAMQAFGLQLNPVDLAAVIHYERNAWGNKSGDVTTPLDILKIAQKQ